MNMRWMSLVSLHLVRVEECRTWNKLINPYSGWVLNTATDITEEGQIVDRDQERSGARLSAYPKVSMLH